MENKNLNLDILPPSQKRLWTELIDIPKEFTLYGGTAVALYLGHRESIDFDFFGKEDFIPQDLISKIPFLSDAEILHSAPNTLTCTINRGEPVKVSFFGLPSLGQVNETNISDDNQIKIASIKDLAGTKVATVQQRAALKDYIDLATMFEKEVVNLPTAISAAKIIYGQQFNPQISLKALTYFDDLDQLTKDHRKTLIQQVQNTDLGNLPDIKPIKGFKNERKMI